MEDGSIRLRRLTVFLTVALIIAATPAHPCSTFCLARDGEVLFGRNYDFEFGDAMVLVNKRGVQKHNYRQSTTWTSRFGSVTFNQYGKEFPMDGMNEAGLVVALMWLDGTEYPADDARPSFGVLEWIQYQLDNYGTVADVIAHANDIRIRRGATPLHYLISDPTGASATIEFLGGDLVVHTGSSLPTANLTNDSYDNSMAYLRGFSGFGGNRGMPGGIASLDRFARTAMMMRSIDSSRPMVDSAFNILRNVAQPDWTRWSIVYDAKRLEVHWTTLRSSSRKLIRMRDLDFNCATAISWIDANTALSGDLTRLLDGYSPAANLDLILHAYASTSFLVDVPREVAERDAAHAESFQCAPFRRSRAVRK